MRRSGTSHMVVTKTYCRGAAPKIKVRSPVFQRSGPPAGGSAWRAARVQRYSLPPGEVAERLKAAVC